MLRYIVAHELAHAYLNHEIVYSKEQHRQGEVEADQLAEQWGFRSPFKNNELSLADQESLRIMFAEFEVKVS